MLLRITPDGGPLFRQIHDQIRGLVLGGELPAGARLPATRALAQDLGVSRTVVALAYDWLKAEGYLTATVGAGTFVSPRFEPRPKSPGRGPSRNAVRLSAWGAAAAAAPWRSPPPERFEFRYAQMEAETLPGAAWRRALARAARKQRPEKGPPEGVDRLRRALAEYLRRSRGVRCHPGQILVVTGSQQALDLVVRVLIERGDRVVLEDPSYPGTRTALLAAGAAISHVPVDDEGLDPSRLEGHGGARLVFVSPSHQFPSGAVLPIHRRLALLEWAAATDTLVVEDDYDSEFRYDRPIEAVQSLDRDGRVLYLGSVSKMLAGGLRVGYLVVPEHLVETFAAAKWLVDRQSPTLEQEALADFIEEGAFERHMRRLRLQYARRREVLMEELRRHFPDGAVSITGADAGIHLIAWLPRMAQRHLSGILDAAARRGVGLASVGGYYDQPPPHVGFLMAYSLPPDDIREGVRRFAESVREVCGPVR